MTVMRRFVTKIWHKPPPDRQRFTVAGGQQDVYRGAHDAMSLKVAATGCP